jgi:hypothetical protein
VLRGARELSSLVFLVFLKTVCRSAVDESEERARELRVLLGSTLHANMAEQ